ncbi:hypothetical protein [Phenylobacterium sp.]|uniref:hypothetical protein n=1 Tax=Phenylobacterium sp. TaxID=1871053 RepID=UPI00120EB11C|nr:hypothetical protein [Phenylobacterium sp.]THD62420.1 MAG: hypothetical protein E8A49_07760 [Phenylobacterium sp.]
MSEGWSSQSNDDLDDIDAWMARRNAQLALQPEADSVARNLWSQANQSGDDLYAGNPSDLTAIGLAALSGAGPYPTTAANDDDQDLDGYAPYPSAPGDGAAGQDDTEASVGGADNRGPDPLTAAGGSAPQGSPIPGTQNPGPDPSQPNGANDPSVSELVVVGRPPDQAPQPGFFDDLNHNPIAQAVGGTTGFLIGLPAGALRGGWHALEGVGHGLNFVGGLFAPGGVAKAWNEASAAAHDALQYGRSAIVDPSRLAKDAISEGAAAIHSLNPFTAPQTDTALGEFGHELGVGANWGETLTNIAGAFAAPEVAAGVDAARTFAATRDANIAEMMGRGMDEPTATYLSKPYKGQGEHAVIPQAQDRILGFKTPWLKDVTISDWIMNSPLNVSKPRGMSQGDFYEYHFGVDPRFYGARLPQGLNGGKGWSGKRLGLERYSGPQQVWVRTPGIYKDTAFGVGSGEALGLLPQDDAEAPQ